MISKLEKPGGMCSDSGENRRIRKVSGNGRDGKAGKKPGI